MYNISKIRGIASQILRGASDIFCDVRLSNPGGTNGEPHVAELALAKFIQDRGHKTLSPREAAGFAFRVACATLKMQKIEDGFTVEIDDDAVLPFASERPRKMAGAA